MDTESHLGSGSRGLGGCRTPIVTFVRPHIVLRNVGGREGQFFNSTGKLVAFDPAILYPGSNALLVHKETFLMFLKSIGYEVIWFLLGGKDIIGGSWNREDWQGELQVSGTFKMKGDKVCGNLRPKFVKPRVTAGIPVRSGPHAVFPE